MLPGTCSRMGGKNGLLREWMFQGMLHGSSSVLLPSIDRPSRLWVVLGLALDPRKGAVVGQAMLVTLINNGSRGSSDRRTWEEPQTGGGWYWYYGILVCFQGPLHGGQRRGCVSVLWRSFRGRWLISWQGGVCSGVDHGQPWPMDNHFPTDSWLDEHGIRLFDHRWSTIKQTVLSGRMLDRRNGCALSGRLAGNIVEGVKVHAFPLGQARPGHLFYCGSIEYHMDTTDTWPQKLIDESLSILRLVLSWTMGPSALDRAQLVGHCGQGAREVLCITIVTVPTFAAFDVDRKDTELRSNGCPT